MRSLFIRDVYDNLQSLMVPSVYVGDMDESQVIKIEEKILNHER